MRLTGIMAWLLGTLCLGAGVAAAGEECRLNADCPRAEVCQDGACVDCARARPSVCTDGTYLSQHACGPVLLADLRQGAGVCVAICEAVVLDLAICNDSTFLSSVCGALEAEAWEADLAALVVAREADPDALLPQAEITSTCFALTQGLEPDSELAEVLVPSPGENGEGCLDDQGEPVDGCLEDAGERTVVKRELYGREGQVFTGFASHYYGLRMADMTRASSASPGDPFDDFSFDLLRATWSANGDRVASCSEYVYESYYQYSLFEDAVRGLGNDYWRMWEIAFERTAVAATVAPLRPKARVEAGSHPKNIGRAIARNTSLHRLMRIPDRAIGARAIAGLPLTARNGDPVQPQPRLASIYKPNPWFRFTGFGAPTLGECSVNIYHPTLCDDDLREAVNEALRNDPPDNTRSFEWHYRKGVALRAQGILDEELTYYTNLADRLAHVRGRRAAAVGTVKAIIYEMIGAGDFDVQTVYDEIELPIPQIDEVFANPAVLDQAVVDARPAGAAQVARKVAGFRAQPAFIGQQLAESVAVLERVDAVRDLLDDPLRGFSFGAGGPEGEPIAYYQQGTPRSASRARTASDHLAAWRAGADQAARPLSDEQRLLLRLRRAIEALFSVERELEAVVSEGHTAGCFRLDDGNPCGWTPKMFAELTLELYGEREALYQKCLEDTAEAGFDAMVHRSFAVNLDPDMDPSAARYPWYNANVGKWPPDPYVACFSDPAGNVARINERPAYREGAFLPGAASQDDCPACNDWARDTTHVTHYFQCIGRWRTLLLDMVEEEVGDLIDPDSGRVQLLDRVGEWWQVGNDDFGAYAGYGFGWAIGNFEEYVDAGGRADLRCDLAPEIYGHFDLAGRVFGGDVAIIDASGHLRYGDNQTAFPDGLPLTPDGRATVSQNQIDIEFLGTSIFREDFQANADGFTFITGMTLRSQEIFSISAIFTIGFVPVTVSAGLSGSVGLQYDAGVYSPAAQQQNDCTLVEAKGSIGPFAAVSAFASASINAVVAEVGVKIELTLIRLDLPLIGRVALEMRPGSVVNLLAEMRLDLIVSLLSGRVLLFLRIAWESWELELFSWDGPRFSTNLFETNAVIPLFDLATALDAYRAEQ